MHWELRKHKHLEVLWLWRLAALALTVLAAHAARRLHLYTCAAGVLSICAIHRCSGAAGWRAWPPINCFCLSAISAWAVLVWVAPHSTNNNANPQPGPPMLLQPAVATGYGELSSQSIFDACLRVERRELAAPTSAIRICICAELLLKLR